ncbi:aldehyde dehydrogenase family protein [Mycobacterium sp. URHB0044]|uniref:aldehyde dehydrogenase family protein n=1 Tax=Mycobacterium sp. URHB0044 TaxID=1380386 RepID=UPI00048C7E2F|nr:aldehyde dehydrogenase family protein [Mycobacterium sp. URHB0044]
MSDRFDPKMLIDGRLVDASTGSTYPNIDPYREIEIGLTPDASVEDADAAVLSAHHAFEGTSWSKDHAFRARCLEQLRDSMLRHRGELRDMLVAEVGCPIFMTDAVQLNMPVDELVDWVELAQTYPFERNMAPHPAMLPPNERLLIREPWGVVALITPYNYPIQQLCYKLGPALAAGNTVVLKPSPLTPWTALFVAKLAVEETDIPPGVFNVITGAGPQSGEALIKHPLVRMIHFTGSTAVGKRIMATAAQGMKKVALELGGKSANIVLDDADVEDVVRFNVARMARHSGQGCTNLTRLLLPRGKYEFGLGVAAQVGPQITWGDPRDPATYMGPQISAANQQRVLRYIEKGLGEGGRLVTGGGVPQAAATGYFVEATVIADVHPDSTIAQEEIFGPVLAVIPYDTDDEAVTIANNSRYGLSGAVWSASDERALSIAKRVRTGTMDVNGATWFARDTPFGGMKESGLGREWGVAGFEEYLDVRVIGYPSK